MKLPCEIISQEILPALRAMIAVNLLRVYGLSQKEVAERMAITQPAVSQYKRELRGYKTKMIRENKELMEFVEEISRRLAYHSLSIEEINLEFCKICEKIKKSGFLYELHKNKYPEINGCTVCLNSGKFQG